MNSVFRTAGDAENWRKGQCGRGKCDTELQGWKCGKTLFSVDSSSRNVTRKLQYGFSSWCAVNEPRRAGGAAQPGGARESRLADESETSEWRSQVADVTLATRDDELLSAVCASPSVTERAKTHDSPTEERWTVE